MKVRYDPDVDAMYINIVEREVAKTKQVDENTIVDYDKEGNVIGVELLFLKERMKEFEPEPQFRNLAEEELQKV